MIRIAITQVVLFLIPFVAYGVWRVATRGSTGAAVARLPWPLFTLVLAGAALVLAGFVVFAMQDDGARGRYVPAHTEDGRFVPGRFSTETDADAPAP